MNPRDDFDDATTTRLRILGGVTQSLDTMSVSEICHNAGVSRQTFYNYFDSKYLLPSWWSQYCEKFFLDRIGFDLSWEEGVIRHVQLMLTNSDFLFRSTMHNDTRSLLAEGETVARRIAAIDRALEYRKVEITDDLSFSVDVYTHDFVNRANDFFRHEQAESFSITAVARRFISIIPPLLYDALQIEEYRRYSQLENYARIGDIARTVLDTPLTLPYSRQA